MRHLILSACVALVLTGSWFAADQRGLTLSAVASDVRGFRLGAQEEPTTPTTKAVAEQSITIVNEALKTGKMGELDTVFAEDYVDHSQEPDEPSGIEGMEEDLRETREVMPDARYTILDLIAEGDKVVVRGTLRGTPDPDLF